ncbi:MAG TPA: pyruvate dehydrogenase complex dihydrolipoamide acetyltransferase [Stellaceae bacterium]|jgi:pyruvate dehydrogenase E2 component (dihydrolipoamide acetyltransferase)|nr:pyruvate dehydrogenase complex dihydrolipoamide acetyltransferase [Stellaceae bacterium]
MSIQILMPALSPTMTEGAVARWLKKEGDEVHSGDVIAEIETDKATMEYEAVDEGRLGKIIVPEGTQGVKVNEPIAVLLEEGEDASALDKVAASAPRGNGAGAPAAPDPAPLLAGGERERDITPRPASGERVPPGVGPATGERQPPHPAEARIFASPLARRMAELAKLDLSTIKGSGPQGRIVKADIDAALAHGGRPTAPAARAPLPTQAPPRAPQQPFAPVTGDPPFTQKPHSQMRRVIARRLTESKQNVPHFYETIDCEIDELLRIRKMLNDGDKDLNVSVNDFVIRAAGLALRQVPAANASWSDDAIILWERADIAMAVALEDGLITPIIRGADLKGLKQIAAETKDLAARARAGKLKLEEFQGGTFSISNLGMYGIREFGAVINPPHGGILAVGAGAPRPVVKDGQLAVATVMSCTLSADHRAVDGAVGAQFLQAFKRLIDEPSRMLL